MTPLSFPPPLTRSQWANKIAARWRDSVQAIIDVGTLLLQAKEQLPHGDFGSMVNEDLPFGWNTANKLMAIARHPVLSNSYHATNLPPSWYTLYELTLIPEAPLTRWLQDGTITSELDRQAVSQLRALAKTPKPTPPPPDTPLGPEIAPGVRLNTVYSMDCLALLAKLPDNSIDCVITSPPYWALRDYHAPGQIGREPTFHQYVAKLCDIFDEVRRVLKPEGTCWVVLGDTYGGTGDKGSCKDPKYPHGRTGQVKALNRTAPSKCLLQIPSRFAIEMTNRAWLLRNTVIWHKPNALPESATDRFTLDFDYLFFFVKSERYWFAQQYEPMAESTLKRINQPTFEHQTGGSKDYINGINPSRSARKALENLKNNLNPNGRHKRCVWTIPVYPLPDPHFAAFPPELPDIPIKAGCPIGGIIFDPFVGSGTVPLAADRLGRHYLGCDINPGYVQIAAQRLAAKKTPARPSA